MSVHRLRSITRGRTDRELHVELTGRLPRVPTNNDAITVSLTNLRRFQGFQVKTTPLLFKSLANAIYEERGSELSSHGSRVFTVHHSPNTVRVFDAETLARQEYAIAGVGPMANISPRFLHTYTVEGGRLSLYSGEGAANKTAMNLQANPAEARAVVDLATYDGFVFDGRTSIVDPAQEPDLHRKVLERYERLGYGPPNRLYKQAVENIFPIGVLN